MTSTPLPTVSVAAPVYGGQRALDDPAETFHEASKLSPRVAAARLPGLLLLRTEPALRASVERAARLHPQRPGLSLPRPGLPHTRLCDALDRRRSTLPPHRAPLRLRALATLLDCAYGSCVRPEGPRRRVPSGGALYPLELYALPLAVSGLETAVYHYDPFAHRLERLGDSAEARLAEALVDPALAPRSAAAVVVTAVFARTRFKYGQRGYRFALLEAGHVAQNLLLAAAALELSALPLGGFYDDRVAALVGADGLDEAPLYVLLVAGEER